MIFKASLLYLASSALLSVCSAVRSRVNVPVEQNNFCTVVKSKSTFVDKTKFIKDIMENKARVILITRPHNFGKTFGLSMLHNFLANNNSQTLNHSLPSQYHSTSDLFYGLEISKDKNFCSNHKYQYPVIYVSFESVIEPTIGGAEAKISSLMGDLYKRHDYLLQNKILEHSDEATFRKILNGTALVKDVKLAISSLSKHLHKATGKKVILLINAYDKPFHTSYFYDYDFEMKYLVGEILAFSLRDNTHVKKAVLTGKLVLIKDSLLSEVKDLNTYTVLHDTKYAHHFGFTEEEFSHLLRETNQITQKMELTVAFNGYNFSGCVVYNPLSIMKSLSEGKSGSYWSEPDLSRILKDFLMAAGMNVKGILVYLFQNNSAVGLIVPAEISFPIAKIDENNLWALLVHTGYLNSVTERKVGDISMHTLRIPTLEAKNCLVNLCNAAFKNKLEKITTDFSNFEKNVKKGDIPAMEKFVGKSLLACGEFYDFKIPNVKQVYQNYILGLLAPLRKSYEITTGVEAGYGHYDIALAPIKEICEDCVGMIIELQIAGDKKSIPAVAEKASHKVNDKHYASEFQGKNYTRFYGVGMAFFQRNVGVRGIELHMLDTAPILDSDEEEEVGPLKDPNFVPPPFPPPVGPEPQTEDTGFNFQPGQYIWGSQLLEDHDTNYTGPQPNENNTGPNFFKPGEYIWGSHLLEEDHNNNTSK